MVETQHLQSKQMQQQQHTTIRPYEVLNMPILEQHFKSLGKIDQVIDLAISMDRLFASKYDTAMMKRRVMQQLIDLGQVQQQLKLLDPTPNWKPTYATFTGQDAMYRQTCLEMTGNALNRMGINAFNYINKMNTQLNPDEPSVAWMCCNEDANGAQFESICENIRHFRDLLSGDAKTEFGGKNYELENKDEIPPCSFRPRGLHCLEGNLVRYNEETNSMEPIVGPIFDLAAWSIYCLPLLLNNDKNRGVGPLLYIPKMQIEDDALLWNDMLCYIEKVHRVPVGTIKVVFLCETFPAIFQLPRLIESFQGRCIGVNCGRWDYLYSYVQTLANHTQVNTLNIGLPSKHAVTTATNLLKMYQIRTAQMCHHYGIQFIGGMNATLPSSNPDLKQREIENESILKKTVDNKVQERQFYGASRTWIAHIGLLAIAKDLRNTPHLKPIDKDLSSLHVQWKDLIEAPKSDKGYGIAEFRNDVRVVLYYMAKYLLTRNGAVAVDGLMEDMATSEISCSLSWYYLRHHMISSLDNLNQLRLELDQIAEGVTKELNSKESEESQASIRKLVQQLKQVLLEVYMNKQKRPTLEKILYSIALLWNTQDSETAERLFKFWSQSKRFQDSIYQYTSIVQQVFASSGTTGSTEFLEKKQRTDELRQPFTKLVI